MCRYNHTTPYDHKSRNYIGFCDIYKAFYHLRKSRASSRLYTLSRS
jgi:hypothetical protein